MYRSLKSDRILITIDELRDRIVADFPQSSLAKVCGELSDIASEAGKRCEWISQPRWALRLATAVIIAGIVGALDMAIVSFDLPNKPFALSEFVQLLEAGSNILVLVGAAILFLITIEKRVKRERALRSIHELRAIAHVIDMHQLTKDPALVRGGIIATQHEGKPKLNAQEMTRYLDFCSEMLSLVGKMAALYVQNFDDAIALTAVNEVENLTTGLSRKIWQKIMIIHSFGDRAYK